jgi:hypothetical protein
LVIAFATLARTFEARSFGETWTLPYRSPILTTKRPGSGVATRRSRLEAEFRVFALLPERRITVLQLAVIELAAIPDISIAVWIVIQILASCHGLF